MILLLFICAIVVLIIYHLWYTHTGTFIYWTRCGILQVPLPLPILGHMAPVFFLRTHFSDLVRRFYGMYKNDSMIGFNDAGTPALIVREPELVKTVLQMDFASFQQNKFVLDKKLDPLLWRNPFFSHGDVWSTSRKGLSHGFSCMRMKVFADSIRSVCNKLTDYLDEEVKKRGTLEVELKDFFSRFTGEVVANVGLGVEGFCFKEENHPASFRKFGNALFGLSTLSGIQLMLTLYFPAIANLLKLRFVPKENDCFFRDLVNRVIELRKSDSERRDDFFQLMVDREQSEEDVATQVFALFLDGYETTSITLSYVAYQLVSHPEVQQKLREEVVSVLAKHDGCIGLESLKDMTYMDRVINESMRMNPSVPVLSKVCTKEFELTGSDGIRCVVKPGTEIIISTHGLHNDSKYWTDPETFDPERFSAERKNEISKYAFIPFGEGPRICVGMRLGLLQTKAALAEFLKNYSFESSPRTKPTLKTDPNSFLLSPVGGLWAIIKHV